MKTLLAVLCSAAAALAAVDGTVTNLTTGKPQGGATVTLYRLGEAGMDAVESVKSSADGKFSINQTVQGPHLIQTAFDGVTYNHMLPQGAPTSGINLEVYQSQPRPGGAKVTQDIVLFETSGEQLRVTESFLWQNDGKTTFNDPDRGTLQVYVPAAGSKSLEVMATSPRSVPVRRAAEPAGKPGVYKIDFPIKPGETTIEISYNIPFAGSSTLEGKRLYPGGGPTSLIAPVGVEVKGDDIELKGQEPRTQATIYQVKGDSYKVEVSGSGVLRRTEQESEGPAISQVLPKLYVRAPWILALGFAILALGFVTLYRAQAPADSPAKGRK